MSTFTKRLLSVMLAAVMVFGNAAPAAAAAAEDDDFFITEEPVDFGDVFDGGEDRSQPNEHSSEKNNITAFRLAPAAAGNENYELVTGITGAAANSSQNGGEGQSDGPAAWAFDGDPNTCWHTKYNDNGTETGETPYAIEWCVGAEPVPVGRIGYLRKNDVDLNVNGRWKNFTVYGKNGAEAQWHEIAIAADPDAPVGAQLHDVQKGEEGFLVFENPEAVTHLKVAVTGTYYSGAPKAVSAGEIRTYRVVEGTPVEPPVDPNADATHAAMDKAPMKKSVTANSQNSGDPNQADGPASNAFDGKTETGWHSHYTKIPEGHIFTLQWNLGKRAAVNRLLYETKGAGQNNGRWKTVKVEVLDGEKSTMVFNQDITIKEEKAVLDLTETWGTAMKVTISSTIGSQKDNFACAGELTVYENPTAVEETVQPVPMVFTLGQKLLSLECGTLNGKNYPGTLTWKLTDPEGVAVTQGVTVTWTTGGEGVVTVENGVVTPVAAGRDVVTATASCQGQEYTASCPVVVRGELVRPEPAQKPGTAEINLGTDKLVASNKKFWIRGEDRICFGDDPRNTWRVLDTEHNNVGGRGIMVISDHVLGKTSFCQPKDKYEEISKRWDISAARQWCGEYLSAHFSAAEQAIMESVSYTDADKYNYGAGTYGSSTLVDDKLFLLSVRELYDYMGNADREGYITSTDFTGKQTEWWLRSPDTGTRGGYYVGTGKGVLGYNSTTDVARGARPAFNLNPGSVLMTNLAGGVWNTAVLGRLAPIPAVPDPGERAGNTWALTLLDGSRSFAVTEESVTGTSVTLHYTGARTGDNEYISALILDAAGTPVYFGRLAKAAAEGTVTMTLPEGLTEGTLKLFNEQYNGEKRTAYASAFDTVTLTAAPEPVADPVAKIGDVNYATLHEAFAAAQNNDTITLVKAVTLGIDQEPAGPLVLDGSRTVTLDACFNILGQGIGAAEAENTVIKVENGSALNLKLSAVIANTAAAHPTCGIHNLGTVTLTATGTFDQPGIVAGAYSDGALTMTAQAVGVRNEGTLTVKMPSNNYVSGVYADSVADARAVALENSGTATVSYGQIIGVASRIASGTAHMVGLQNTGTANIGSDQNNKSALIAGARPIFYEANDFGTVGGEIVGIRNEGNLNLIGTSRIRSIERNGRPVAVTGDNLAMDAVIQVSGKLVTDRPVAYQNYTPDIHGKWSVDMSGTFTPNALRILGGETELYAGGISLDGPDYAPVLLEDGKLTIRNRSNDKTDVLRGVKLQNFSGPALKVAATATVAPVIEGGTFGYFNNQDPNAVDIVSENPEIRGFLTGGIFYHGFAEDHNDPALIASGYEAKQGSTSGNMWQESATGNAYRIVEKPVVQVPVTFQVEGRTYREINVLQGQPIGDQMPENPTVAGKNFLGWVCGGEEVTRDTVVQMPMLVEARLEVIPVADPVAMIGDTGYATLHGAFEAARDGDTVTLLKEVTFGRNGEPLTEITVDRDVTLRMENHNIYGSIVDGSQAYNPVNGLFVITGTLTVSGGDIVNAYWDSDAVVDANHPAILVEDAGTLNLRANVYGIESRKAVLTLISSVSAIHNRGTVNAESGFIVGLRNSYTAKNSTRQPVTVTGILDSGTVDLGNVSVFGTQGGRLDSMIHAVGITSTGTVSITGTNGPTVAGAYTDNVYSSADNATQLTGLRMNAGSTLNITDPQAEIYGGKCRSEAAGTDSAAIRLENIAGGSIAAGLFVANTDYPDPAVMDIRGSLPGLISGGIFGHDFAEGKNDPALLAPDRMVLRGSCNTGKWESDLSGSRWKVFDTAAVNVTARVNGNAVGGVSLEHLIAKSGVAAEAVTSLEFVSGFVTEADLIHAGTLPNLTTFKCNLNDHLTVQKVLNFEKEFPKDAFSRSYGADPHQKLEVVELNGFARVMNNAFQNCPALRSFTASDVTFLGDHSFDGCTALTTVVTPSVTDIGSYTFAGTTALKTVDLSRIQTLDWYAFIDSGVFRNEQDILEVTLPDTLTRLDFRVFGSGNPLTGTPETPTVFHVILEGTTPPRVAADSFFPGEYAFAHPAEGSYVAVPQGAEEAYRTHDAYKAENGTWAGLHLGMPAVKEYVDVTFVNGGHTETVRVEKGQPLTALPAAPTAPRYKIFKGWFNGETQADTTTPISAPVTYTAVFGLQEMTGRDVNFYVYIDKAPVLVANRTGLTVYKIDGRQSISASLLAEIYGSYGFTAEQLTAGSRLFANTDRGSGTIYADVEAKVVDGLGYAPTLNRDQKTQIDVFYLPNHSVTNNTGRTNAEMMAKETFYTVSNDQNADKVYVLNGTAIGEARMPAEPTREGFTFTGWKAGEEPVDASTVVNSALHLTAQWEARGVCRIRETGTAYETVAAAAGAAQAGQTIVMLQDAAEDLVVLRKGVTLDLNGKNLTAESVLAFKGNHIVDTTAHLGRLIAADAVLDETNAQMAVYDGTGYRFGSMVMKQELQKVDANTLKVFMMPFFVDKPVSKSLFADGAKDNRIEMGAILTWTRSDGSAATQTFVFSDSMVAKAYQGGTLVINITGVEGLQNVQVRTMAISGTGIVTCGEELIR